MMDTLMYYLGGTEVPAPTPPITVDDVLKGVEEMEKKGIALRDTIRNFPVTPPGTLTEALVIHNEVAALQAMVDKTAADVKAVPTPISTDDSNKVLAAVERVMPLIEETMKLIVEKKTVFENIPPGGLTYIVKMDLDMFYTSAKGLEDAVIASTPPELLEIAKEIVAKLEAIFKETVAAYT